MLRKRLLTPPHNRERKVSASVSILTSKNSIWSVSQRLLGARLKAEIESK